MSPVWPSLSRASSTNMVVRYTCHRAGVSSIVVTIYVLQHKPIDFAWRKRCSEPKIHTSKALTAPQAMTFAFLVCGGIGMVVCMVCLFCSSDQACHFVRKRTRISCFRVPSPRRQVAALRGPRTVATTGRSSSGMWDRILRRWAMSMTRKSYTTLGVADSEDVMRNRGTTDVMRFCTHASVCLRIFVQGIFPQQLQLALAWAMSRILASTSVTAGTLSHDKLRKSPFFADCDASFLTRLIKDLSEMIMKKGDHADKMYYLMMGEVEVLLSNNIRVAKLQDPVILWISTLVVSTCTDNG
eukprot:s963_g12.t1